MNSTTNTSLWRRRLKLLPLVLAALLIGYLAGNRFGKPMLLGEQVELITEPVTLPAFELGDEEDQPFRNEQLLDHWNILAVGSTEDAACRELLSRYSEAWNRLAHLPEIQARTRLILLASGPNDLDPRARWHFIRYYNVEFHALAGDAGAFADISALVGSSCPDQGHTLVVTPAGEPIARIASSVDAVALAKALAQLIESH